MMIYFENHFREDNVWPVEILSSNLQSQVMGLQDDIAYVGILIASIVFGYVFYY